MRKGLVRASVCVVLLAASAAAPSLAGATENSEAGYAAKLVQAYAALEQGQAERAASLYTRLINSRKLPPELLARALLNRGLAHQRLGAMDAAITDYDAALRIKALSARARVTALYNRALAFRAMGDAGRATEDLTAALYIDPAFAPAWFARGNILHERGLYYLALADYDQAIANGHVEKHRVHYARALLFSALNNLPRTQEALYAALKEKPDFRPARQRLAAILQGKLPKTRLFADLVKRPAKRITARITPVAGSGAAETNFRSAAVMVVGAPVLNVRKTPQAVPVVPPGATPQVVAQAEVKTVAKAKTEANTASSGTSMVAAQSRKPWRVASLGAVAAPGRDMAAAPEKAGQKTGQQPAKPGKAALHTASVALLAKPHDVQPRRQYAGWAVQIASQRSEQAARAFWSKVQGKVRKRVRGGEVAIVRAEIDGKGTFYRVRLVGFDQRAAAKRACRGLKRGRISCIVVRADG